MSEHERDADGPGHSQPAEWRREQAGADIDPLTDDMERKIDAMTVYDRKALEIDPLTGVTLRRLSDRESRFVEARLVEENDARAAMVAGWPVSEARKAGRRLADDPVIQHALAEARELRAARVGVTPDDIVREFLLIARSSLDDYVISDDGDVTLADGVPSEAMRAVSAIERRVAVGKDGSTITTVKLKLWPKNDALRALADHLGMFVQKDRGADDNPLAILRDALLTAINTRGQNTQINATQNQVLLDAGIDPHAKTEKTAVLTSIAALRGAASPE